MKYEPRCLKLSNRWTRARPKSTEQELLERIRRLPPERVAEVEDFVDFLRLRERERQLTDTALRSRL
jgi:hypothetical protein